jgi:hypothetical protein
MPPGVPAILRLAAKMVASSPALLSDSDERRRLLERAARMSGVPDEHAATFVERWVSNDEFITLIDENVRAQKNLPKSGDTKPCPNPEGCNGVAVYEWRRRGPLDQEPMTVAAGWECSRCGHFEQADVAW